ncbi:DUF2497 domain-containing protein [Rhizobium sp. RM]|uniref:PopZ family protein n=1 Tax=Rhizobium sp. RM TaxID=2748079 RepID=UPI00110D63E4|nr:DUF2497 domain-containing protein [Rhizobium sp. RM]NWJ26352.1 DUF2497 domain-containing protein [Rhizobium sp. RM]TMV19847.1 DUF2497 domain-containing protein [Rhizobium sp. Td3]
MAQPSVAREPSMEEILASIRRIIESNEPGPAGAFSGQLPPVYDDEDEMVAETSFAADTSSLPTRVPPAANQPYGQRPAQEFASMSEQQESAGEKTMSLADVAARVRAAADRNAAMGPQAFAAQAQQRRAEELAQAASPVAPAPIERPVAQRPTDVRPLMVAAQQESREQPNFGAVEDRAAAAAIENVAVAEPRFENVALRGAIETPVVEERFEAPSLVLPEIEEAPQFEAQIEPIQQPEEPQAEGMSSLNSLISAAAGEQIARSFGELAEVFDGVERRSLEDMAQEMLRPMLQDWLEDNLPTLVERLVREEIERVARGSRR